MVTADASRVGQSAERLPVFLFERCNEVAKNTADPDVVNTLGVSARSVSNQSCGCAFTLTANPYEGKSRRLPAILPGSGRVSRSCLEVTTADTFDSSLGSHLTNSSDGASERSGRASVRRDERKMVRLVIMNGDLTTYFALLQPLVPAC